MILRFLFGSLFNPADFHGGLLVSLVLCFWFLIGIRGDDKEIGLWFRSAQIVVLLSSIQQYLLEILGLLLFRSLIDFAILIGDYLDWGSYSLWQNPESFNQVESKNKERIDSDHGQGNHGFSVGRGYGRGGFGGRGRQGGYRGGARAGRGFPYLRKFLGSNSSETGRDAGSVPEISSVPGSVEFPAVPSQNLIDEGKQITDGPNQTELRSPSGRGNVQNITDSSTGASGNLNPMAVEDAQIEEGEVKANFFGNDLDGEIDDLAQFDGEFDFDMENVYGEDDQPFQMEGLVVDSIGMVGLEDDGFVFPDVSVEMEKIDVEVMGTEGLEIDEKKKIKENEYEIIKALGDKNDGKKKQPRSSSLLTGATSKKRNTALLSSPRRTVPPKLGGGAKDGGKDKDGKVALSKLPGGP